MVKVTKIRRRTVRSGLLVALAGTAIISGCGSSGPERLSASALATKIIPAPDGFTVDTTPGANGQMSPQIFTEYGGAGSARSAGFVAGFKQNYVDDETEEGISVTVEEFTSPAKADAYFRATAYKILSFADPSYGPLPKLTGAIEASGTKIYDGNHVHGMADSTGPFYFLMAYDNPNTSDLPVEFSIWADAEWALLQPGVTLPELSPTTNTES